MDILIHANLRISLDRTFKGMTPKANDVISDYFRDRLGMFEVAGTRAWLGRIRANQQALSMPGPVTEDLVILVNITSAAR